MTLSTKLLALHDRMSSEQRRTILQAAEAGTLPASGALEHIARLEGSLAAIDALLDDEEAATALRRDDPTDDVERGSPLAVGTVKWFNLTKGFGFIHPDNGGPDAFVHISAVERSGMTQLREGQKLSYDLVSDNRTGKQAAGNLKLVA